MESLLSNSYSVKPSSQPTNRQTHSTKPGILQPTNRPSNCFKRLLKSSAKVASLKMARSSCLGSPPYEHLMLAFKIVLGWPTNRHPKNEIHSLGMIRTPRRLPPSSSEAALKPIGSKGARSTWSSSPGGPVGGPLGGPEEALHLWGFHPNKRDEAMRNGEVAVNLFMKRTSEILWYQETPQIESKKSLRLQSLWPQIVAFLIQSWTESEGESWSFGFIPNTT